MQSPVRYYITQGDDQAVVHCVHCVRVPAQNVETESEKVVETVQAAAPVEQRPEQADRARMARLVRAATRRAWTHR
jgi:hypothetical protein